MDRLDRGRGLGRGKEEEGEEGMGEEDTAAVEEGRGGMEEVALPPLLSSALRGLPPSRRLPSPPLPPLPSLPLVGGEALRGRLAPSSRREDEGAGRGGRLGGTSEGRGEKGEDTGGGGRDEEEEEEERTVEEVEVWEDDEEEEEEVRGIGSAEVGRMGGGGVWVCEGTSSREGMWAEERGLLSTKGRADPPSPPPPQSNHHTRHRHQKEGRRRREGMEGPPLNRGEGEAGHHRGPRERSIAEPPLQGPPLPPPPQPL